MTTPRTPRGRSRLDRKASAKEATAKGSAGDSAVMALLRTLGYSRYADLSRTYSGADLLAICGCGGRHLLWVESKAYPWSKIDKESLAHAQARAEEVEAVGDAYAIFTYQRPHGNRYARPTWYFRVPAEPGGFWSDPLEFKSFKHYLEPECGTPLPEGSGTHPVAPPDPTSLD